MQPTASSGDRRHRRRQESIEEILDVSLELMADQGVAGLSLGEVARKLGIRPPSLYVYFASKNALYDALFTRGADEVLSLMRAEAAAALDRYDDLESVLLHAGSAMVRWSVDHPVYSQLLFWRPVPGFEPSPNAYAPAVELIEFSHTMFADFQQRGWIRDDVEVMDVLRDWTIVTAGITSQQLSNEPGQNFDSGRFTAALPGIVTMFVSHYATDRTTPRPAHGRKAPTTKRKVSHAHAR